MKTAIKKYFPFIAIVIWITALAAFFAYVGGRSLQAEFLPPLTALSHILQRHIWAVLIIHLVCYSVVYFGWGALVRRAVAAKKLTGETAAHVLNGRWQLITAMAVIDALLILRGAL